MINAELVGAICLRDACSPVFYADRASKSREAFDCFLCVHRERKARLLVSVNAYDGKISRVAECPVPYKEGADEQNEHEGIYYNVLFLEICHAVNLSCVL